MTQSDSVRLNRFWQRVDILLQSLTKEQLQSLLDGMDLLWAATWDLLDARPIIRSEFINLPRAPTSSPTQIHHAQVRLRALLRACKNHSMAVESLVQNEALIRILACHELDLLGLLRSCLYDVELTWESPYRLLQACEFRTVSPDVLDGVHHHTSRKGVGRHTFLLARSGYTGDTDTEAQVQDMHGEVASLVQLLHFCRQHSDLGDQTLYVPALASRWMSRRTRTEVCAVMTYQDGERHLLAVPTKDLSCRSEHVRILAWRKPGP